jgi:glycosyltransferase involved in cell wall biosynthesis
MKVAIVSEHASPLAALGGVDAGGQNVHVAALATELGRQGVNVVVHTRRDDRSLAEWVELAPNVAIHHVDAGPARHVPKDRLLPYMDAFAVELARAWTHDRPDVAHAHFWMSGQASVAAGAVAGVPVVQTFHALGVVKRRHQGEQDTSPAARLTTERDLLGEVDKVVATCSDEVTELAGLGADLNRVEVVPCGVDVDLFRPDRRGHRPTGRVLMVGRLVERKGVADAIEAIADVPGAELVVAGGPDRGDLDADAEARRLRALAESLGVGDRVHLVGRVTRQNLPALLRSVDVVACVPWYEPFGLVPLEAMACGVPVVASSVGGLLDTVVDGVTGIHVEPRSPLALAEALRRILADAELGRRLGAAGVARVRAIYRWPRVARSTLAVYRELHRPVLTAEVRGRG